MKKIAVLLSSMTALAACMPQLEEGLSTKLSAEQLSAVDAGVRLALREPGSAQITGLSAVRYAEASDVFFVCGYVNAKNGFGGYSGFLPFSGHLFPAGTGYKYDLTNIGKSEDDNFGIRYVCKERGAPI